jgi:DAK2 domain fusion protein YloV
MGITLATVVPIWFDLGGNSGSGSSNAEIRRLTYTNLERLWGVAVAHSGDYIDGTDCANALAAASEALEQNIAVINGMNVFPVPDGDTGTNMFLTVKAIRERLSESKENAAGLVLEAMGEAALLNARGNSGVILSQFFIGLARGVGGKPKIDGRILAHALKSASDSSYQAVGRPVEGTMLTVIRKAAEAAASSVNDDNHDVPTIMAAACRGAKLALDQTPDLLPILKRAGVVDAGGQGVFVILEAMRRSISGEETGEPLIIRGDGADLSGITDEFLDDTEEDVYGYCTQFLLNGEELDVGDIKQDMNDLASSAVVVGNQSTVRIHVHALDPGPVISYGTKRGTLSQIIVQNMDEQHREFLLSQRQDQRKLAVVAVSWGAGFAGIFDQLGAGVVHSGDTMNPSIQELIEVARRQKAQEIIVLTNNPNVVLAAQQAADLFDDSALLVIATETLPQGVASLLAFNPDLSGRDNIDAMTLAARAIKTGEITQADRDTEMDGVLCRAGQFIGLLDGRLVVAGDEEIEVLTELISHAEPEEGSLITLYYGEGVSLDQAQETGDQIIDASPGTEVEIVYGGQPLYTYILSIE